MPEKKKVNEHAKHRERMRERVLKNGFDTLMDHEKLEYLLFYTIPRENTNPIGHRLMERFGSFSAVLNANVSELCKVDGVGEKSAVFLHLIPQVAECYASDKTLHGSVLSDSGALGEYLVGRFVGSTVEKMLLLCLNNKYELICEHEISRGNVNRTALDARKILEIALANNASCVVLAHNHPAGVCIPSSADIENTKRLFDLLAAVDIRLVEHYVIADDKYMPILHA